MNNPQEWFLIETDNMYNSAVTRYEVVKYASQGTEEHREKLLLAHSIENYENTLWDLPEVDPIEMIKILMDDFGYKATDLASE